MPFFQYSNKVFLKIKQLIIDCASKFALILVNLYFIGNKIRL
jgi:hypothetical protein